MNLQASLPLLLPKAIAWAEVEASRVAASGRVLSVDELGVGRKVGVVQPELIRIAIVDQLPLPQDPSLRSAAIESGLLGPGMVGLTLGHSVFICRGHETWRVRAHEFRHVHQYEKAGSIAAFLPVYLQHVVTVGYNNAPFEIDARAFERVGP